MEDLPYSLVTCMSMMLADLHQVKITYTYWIDVGKVHHRPVPTGPRGHPQSTIPKIWLPTFSSTVQEARETVESA